MERIKKLKKEAIEKSQSLLREKQEIVAQAQKMQQRVQQIDVQVVALSGKVQGFDELLEPEKVKEVTPKKKK